MPQPKLTASCACGCVDVTVFGAPIACSICYCRDCQRGAQQIEALPNASGVAETDGGTSYVLYRNDRVTCTRGHARLTSYKLRERSPTNRVVASCCNTAMLVNFDRGPHWVSVYHTRLGENAPRPQMRICTRFKRDDVVLPSDMPNHPGYPPSLVVKLLAARLAMLIGRTSPGLAEIGRA
ncbi:hypothetical protein JQ557_17920 [Bradyrhizobium sp. U87765 SZCCT0131]|nr:MULTISPECIES: hypothetical protein [unclassified Bradyrhizobium]MBR1219891.1 hypothetical protein [Bradyrhizobium sp. U87765 SZCCT0131]MBR1260481.1 hypothetical protein [Bradyrhizobium sp. U87765 SZCCT0134]MBR1309222.1 hypothetical protein [Bradyrhizobium sp. U87765 SZCCT0110]MBR1323985.1 hypothetical protein [Bradyrhizobium sp. U87765 SZCCT0109]MBR1349537.1 hypothetical protein [Bradyrhizobium sp. U87765 SZCCT0048]